MQETFEYEIKVKPGDGYYVYRNDQLFGWVGTIDEAEILVKHDQMKSGIKNKKLGGQRIPY